MTYQEAIDERDFHLDGWREGDPAAFKSLFIQLYPGFFSFASALLSEGEAAREVTMEAFFIGWKKREDLDELKNIKAFLYNTIRNHSLNYLRQLQRDPSSAEYIPLFYPDASLPEALIREIRAYVASGI